MTARERGFWAGLHLTCGVALFAAAIVQEGNEWRAFFGAVLFVLALYHWQMEATS